MYTLSIYRCCRPSLWWISRTSICTTFSRTIWCTNIGLPLNGSTQIAAHIWKRSNHQRFICYRRENSTNCKYDKQKCHLPHITSIKKKMHETKILFNFIFFLRKKNRIKPNQTEQHQLLKENHRTACNWSQISYLLHMLSFARHQMKQRKEH